MATRPLVEKPHTATLENSSQKSSDRVPRASPATATRNGLTTLGPEVAQRSGSRPAITDSIRRMVDALATLSSMVGAVVLARLANDPELAGELFAAARQAASLH